MLGVCLCKSILQNELSLINRSKCKSVLPFKKAKITFTNTQRQQAWCSLFFAFQNELNLLQPEQFLKLQDGL